MYENIEFKSIKSPPASPADGRKRGTELICDVVRFDITSSMIIRF